MTRIDLQIKKHCSTYSAVGAGFIALDIVEGRTTTFATSGGSCGNVMAMLAWLGWNAIPSSRIGRDAASEFIMQEYEKIGVDTSRLILDERVSTPIVIQKFTETADGGRSHRFSLSCPDCGSWLPRFRPMTIKHAEPLLTSKLKPQVLYLDRVTPASLRLARWARELGTLVMLEPSSIGDEKSFLRAVDLCDVLKYSWERLGHVPDLAEAKSPKVIIETKGQDGLRIRWRGHWSSLPAFRAPVFEDAAGSGDWCSAGFLHLIGFRGAAGLDTLKKADLSRALKFGQALAAINCRFEGARGLMTFMELPQANRALRSLVENGEIVDIDLGSETDRSLPKDLCNLCKPENRKKSSSWRSRKLKAQ